MRGVKVIKYGFIRLSVFDSHRECTLEHTMNREMKFFISTKGLTSLAIEFLKSRGFSVVKNKPLNDKKEDEE